MASKLRNNFLPEFLAFITGRPKPSMVTVNLTSRCNQHCIYCEIGQGITSESNGSLTKENLFWILDEMASQKLTRISLCGGEPFLFEGLMEIVVYAGKKNIRCSITSNGMTLHKLKEEEYAILRQYKADINLSMDSFEEEIQVLTRGTATALSNALLSIEKLKKEQIPFTVLTAISTYNYHHLFSFIVQTHQAGISQVLFQPIIYFTNYPDRMTIHGKERLNVPLSGVEELMDNLYLIKNFEKDHNIRTNVYRILPWIEAYLSGISNQEGHWFFEEFLRTFYCREIHATIDIDYDGGIQPCGLTRAKINIRDAGNSGLMELWKKATREIKSDISQGKYYPYCNACCHKFSRNMYASVMKYPFRNRAALRKILPLLINRSLTMAIKKTLNLK